VQDHLLRRQLLARVQRRPHVLVRRHGLQPDAVIFSYYGFSIRDKTAVSAIIEGRDHTHTIDVVKIRAALHEKTEVAGEGRMQWFLNDDYLFVDILPSHVVVTHNDGRTSFQVEVLFGVFSGLRDVGLHIYDPQQGQFFA
jgi:hypothetical protein